MNDENVNPNINNIKTKIQSTKRTNSNININRRIINEKGEKQLGLYLKGKKLKYLDESEFKDDIKKLDEEIEQINHIFNNHEFFVKNKDLMNITLDQT